jgi:hypothetical protein
VTRGAWYLDALERVVWTALQVLAAEVIVLREVSWEVVGTAALIALCKAVIAVNLPWTAEDSASSLPQSLDPPTEPPG